MENEPERPVDAPGPESPSDPPERAMFDKPNLQLRDPDPYAFANRIRKLVVIAGVLATLAVAPFLAGVFSYQIKRGQMQAEYEAATAALGEIAPQLMAFEEASRSIARKVGPSVVSINKVRYSQRGPIMEGVGSGFIVDPDGYVITNFHVVDGAERLFVRMSTGETSDATIVGGDQATDLAVLKIDGGDLPALEWADSENLEMGDLVWAVGSPFGLENSITFGIVSSKARRASDGVTNEIYQEFFQSDAAVNPGNSGGPMVNLAGEVVGVNTMIIGQSFRGVSFSIPSDLASDEYLEIREKGYVERGFLGVRPELPDPTTQRRLELAQGEGVLVTRLQRNTPASIAGLKNNDVILQWNDHKAFDPTVLSREISDTEIGSTAKVLVKRLENGKPIEKEITVKVGRQARR